jgi:asparagine synthase (glutamine-hydrolysing)
MCGIVGIVGKNNNNGIVLSQMLQAQAHRGPDANQTYCNGTVFLGHNRLNRKCEPTNDK